MFYYHKTETIKILVTADHKWSAVISDNTGVAYMSPEQNSNSQVEQ